MSHTNMSVYKSAVASINKTEEYPSVLEEIEVCYARELFKGRKYAHNVSFAGHIWFIDEFSRPIKVRGVKNKKAYVMSFDYFRNDKKEPV